MINFQSSCIVIYFSYIYFMINAKSSFAIYEISTQNWKINQKLKLCIHYTRSARSVSCYSPKTTLLQCLVPNKPQRQRQTKVEMSSYFYFYFYFHYVISTVTVSWTVIFTDTFQNQKFQFEKKLYSNFDNVKSFKSIDCREVYRFTKFGGLAAMKQA